jgi:type I restriction enzyme M protein
MIGAVIGDIAGSRYEFHNIKKKDFILMDDYSKFTDDSVLTIAVGRAVLEYKQNGGDLSAMAKKYMLEIGRQYPNCGYGMSFFQWMFKNPEPYGSFGNGSAMRVSPCGFAAESLEDAVDMAEKTAIVSHNHPEGIKGAKAIAAAIFLARDGKTIDEIKEYTINNFYPIDFTVESLRSTYQFSAFCADSVPQAMECFFEAKDYEDTIRNAISIGGDSDTIACMAGGIAEAYYGVPEKMAEKGYSYLDSALLEDIQKFEEAYPPYTIVSRETM